MATQRERVNPNEGDTSNPNMRKPIDIDGATGQPIAEDLPIHDEEGSGDDPRSQLSRLALSMMGCKPELSVAQDQVITIAGKEQSAKVGKDVLQAIIFGHITGLTGPKELPNAKSEAEKYTFGLKGRIEGVNAISGEMFKAAILYLPAGFHDMFLAEAEAQIARAGKGQANIAFALEFWSIPAGNPRGYSWKAVNKLPMEKTDPLAGLRRRALAGATVKGLTFDDKGQHKVIA